MNQITEIDTVKAEDLSREEHYFWHRTDADAAEAEAYYLSVLAKQDAELAAWVTANAWMDSL